MGRLYGLDANLAKLEMRVQISLKLASVWACCYSLMPTTKPLVPAVFS